MLDFTDVTVCVSSLFAPKEKVRKNYCHHKLHRQSFDSAMMLEDLWED